MDDDVGIALSVRDEQGRPVPHVTVWAYVLPRASPIAIDGDDLWRIATRYRSSFEFATPFNRIVPTLQVLPMGDAAGQVRSAIEYKFLEGSAARRPPSMSIGFAVMKRGYLPARIDFTATKESRVAGDLVLKRDSAYAPETRLYLQEFERVRSELSDTRRNEDISQSSHQRLEELRRALEAAAAQALTAGDRSAAARIYARMQYLPAIRFNEGRPAGFVQADPLSEQSQGYLAKAYEADRTNAYIAAKSLFRRGAEQFGIKPYRPERESEERRRDFAAFLAELHTLMRTRGHEIWPEYHMLYALWHRKSSDPSERQQVVPLLEALYKSEPKYQAREKLLQTPLA